MPQVNSQPNVTVDLSKPSHYHAPQSGTRRAFLHYWKQRLSYWHYKLLPSKEQIREVRIACISRPPAHKWAGYMTAPHKWGFNTCFLSPIYGALFCSTGIHARVGGQSLGFDVWIGVMLLRYGGLAPDVACAIAEIGCGPGTLLQFMEAWFPNATIIGFDYDPRLLDDAKQRTRRTGLVEGNAEQLPFGDGEFKTLVSLHLIEHLYYPEHLVDEAYRVLAPKGIFILATPNPKGLGARFMGHKWAGWREDHVALKSPDEWAELFRARGFTPLRERTTLLTGIPAFRKFPLAILNWGLLLLFGTFPWKYGEAYIAVWQKQ